MAKVVSLPDAVEIDIREDETLLVDIGAFALAGINALDFDTATGPLRSLRSVHQGAASLEPISSTLSELIQI